MVLYGRQVYRIKKKLFKPIFNMHLYMNTFKKYIEFQKYWTPGKALILLGSHYFKSNASNYSSTNETRLYVLS